MKDQSEKADRPLLVWMRDDLRISDNPALDEACRSGRPVITVYILDEKTGNLRPIGGASHWWLHHSLTSLASAIEHLGGRLILRRGASGSIIPAILEETGADTIYWNRRYEPAAIAIDSALKESLAGDGFTVRSFSGRLLHEPTRVQTESGGPYRVYGPFWRALERGGEPREPLPAPKAIQPPETWPKSETLDDWNLLPAKPDWSGGIAEAWTPGERAARERLDHFIGSGLRGYGDNRDLPASADATSRLSPHLAFGEISPYQVWHATRGLSERIPKNDMLKFRKELVWREFSYHLLFHYPSLPNENYNNRFDTFEWHDNRKALHAWQKGLTGYPIVDAGMRQLWQIGWLHNRVRMIVASFLTKHLLLHWREGENWFWDTLVDADPASNSASWQWVAGSGADAAPYFRIFNPILQGEKFDPDGAYVRTYVPELEKLSRKYIHKPWEAPEKELESAGIKLGRTYPKPIVDHAIARARALAAYDAIKDAA